MFGLDGEIPEQHPPLKVREGVLVRRWPGTFLTPRVRVFFDLWRMRRDGIPIRADAGMLWPAPLVQALQALDYEHSLVR